MKLVDLPPELAIRVHAFCAPVEVFHLSQTCRHLRSIASLDDVWRPLCRELWREHRSPAAAADGHDELRLFDGEDWLAAWQGLFGKYRRYLGAPALPRTHYLRSVN